MTKPTFSRRQFIELGISSLILPSVISSVTFGQTTRMENSGQLFLSLSSDPGKYGHENRILIFDLNNLTSSFIPINFSAHSFATHPLDKETIMAIGKWEKHFCIVNKREKKVRKEVVLESDKVEFGGHGSFSTDGKYFFVSVIEHENGTYPRKRPGNGKIHVYETESLKLINEFKSHGLEPHESILLNDGKTLLVLNAGGRQDLFKEHGGEEYFEANVAFLNIENGNLLKEVKLGKRKSYLQHIAGKSGEDIIAVGYEVGRDEKKVPYIVKISSTGIITPIGNSFLPNKSGFLISSRFDKDSKYFLSTLPQSGIMYLGDIREKKILKSLSLDGYPSGVDVSLDNKSFIVNTLNGIFQVDIEKFKVEKKLFYNKDFNLGSHSVVV